jgi:uncharacterized protein (DUF1919 family)
MKTIKDVSKHLEEKIYYLEKHLTNLTKKPVNVCIVKEKGMITDVKIETVKDWNKK